MRDLKLIYLMFFIGVGSVVLGLPYALKIFGPTEAVVALWGRTSVFIGILLIISSFALRPVKTKAIKFLLALEFSILALLQVFPIFFWIVMYGQGITDLPYQPGDFIAHWGYSIPHLIIFVNAVLVIYLLLRNAKD
ncbi:MAG: hypothetical protein QHH75_03960 [Bacillota bacterium]|nr:hypothetical protein [Bacillota bacterium]